MRSHWNFHPILIFSVSTEIKPNYRSSKMFLKEKNYLSLKKAYIWNETRPSIKFSTFKKFSIQSMRPEKMCEENGIETKINHSKAEPYALSEYQRSMHAIFWPAYKKIWTWPLSKNFQPSHRFLWHMYGKIHYGILLS